MSLAQPASAAHSAIMTPTAAIFRVSFETSIAIPISKVRLTLRTAHPEKLRSVLRNDGAHTKFVIEA
jgi:hypothetical protein